MSTKSIQLTDANGDTMLPISAVVSYNSNGNYAKFADGTLIQWGQQTDSVTLVEDTTHFGNTAYRSTQTIQFPIPFVQVGSSATGPRVNAWVNIGNGYSLLVWMPINLTEFSADAISYYVSGTKNVTCNWIAIGRWK